MDLNKLKELADIYTNGDELIEQIRHMLAIEYESCISNDNNNQPIQVYNSDCEDDTILEQIGEVPEIKIYDTGVCADKIVSITADITNRLQEVAAESIIDSFGRAIIELFILSFNNIIQLNDKEDMIYEYVDSIDIISDVKEHSAFVHIYNSIKDIVYNHNRSGIITKISYGAGGNRYRAVSAIMDSVYPVLSRNTRFVTLINDSVNDGSIINSYDIDRYDPNLTDGIIEARLMALSSRFEDIYSIIDKKRGDTIQIVNDDYYIGKYIDEFNELSKWKSISYIESEFKNRLGDCYDNVANDDQPDILNLSHNTHISNGPDLLNIKYWKRYCSILTTVALSPNFWTTGLLIPSPGGLIPIKLPILWVPIAVFYTPPVINVIIITLNGTIVYPVVWQYRMEPVSNASSFFLQLFRGANILIKEKTNVRFSVVYEGGIDTNPDESRVVPNVEDDLPTYERLSISNINLVKYMTKWLNRCKPYMGYPL